MPRPVQKADALQAFAEGPKELGGEMQKQSTQWLWGVIGKPLGSWPQTYFSLGPCFQVPGATCKEPVGEL